MKENKNLQYILALLLLVIMTAGIMVTGTARVIALVVACVLVIGILSYMLSVKLYRDRLKKNIIIVILAILILGGTAFYSIYKMRSLNQEIQSKQQGK